MEIQHFSHQHPLTPCSKKKKKPKNEVHCSGCCRGISFSGPSYSCTKCQFHLHKSCAELPRRIQHPFHQLHPLILLPNAPNRSRNFTCRLCSQGCSGFTFHCSDSDCEFDLDVECAMFISTITNEQREHQIQHFSHPCPLIPYDCNMDKLHCSGCDLRIKGGLIYVCPDCIFILHKSCVDLPREIEHPFHPLHPLTLLTDPVTEFFEQGIFFKCNACGNNIHHFIFYCAQCGFSLDVGCASLMPNIMYVSHDHLLAFFNRPIDFFDCNICDDCCDEPFLRCVECNFNLHESCIPTLPCTIKHERHLHPLTLTDPLPEDDSDEYICDACEEKRNPKHSVYYCAECEFVAHIDCGTSEVVPLEGESSLACKAMVVEGREPKWANQESYIEVKEVEMKSASAIDDLSGAPAVVGSKVLGDKANADPDIAKLDGEIAKVRLELETHQIKLKALEEHK